MEKTQPTTTSKTGISYEGPKDAKKFDLAGCGKDAKLVCIATNLETNEE